MPISVRLRETVYLRDARAIWEVSESERPFESWLRREAPVSMCLVAVLDPLASARCSGHWTLEHVKCELRMAKRACASRYG